MTVDSNPISLISRSGIYRIRVAGRLGAEWSDRFGGMTVSVTEDKHIGVITELRGMLPDQAALMGVLDQLYTFGVPLLNVECLEVLP